jgi:hypothetical protein
MRWFVAFLAWVVTVPVSAQDEKGDKLLQGFEKKLKDAKAYYLTFDMKYDPATS